MRRVARPRGTASTTAVARTSALVSSHLQLAAQDPVQEQEQAEARSDEHGGIEREDADGGAVIALLRAEENVRLAAAPVIVLLHLRVRDQVGDFLIHVKLFGGNRTVRVLESSTMEGHFSIQDSVDHGQVLLQLARGACLEARKNGERLFQVVKSFRIAGFSLVSG